MPEIEEHGLERWPASAIPLGQVCVWVGGWVEESGKRGEGEGGGRRERGGWERWGGWRGEEREGRMGEVGWVEWGKEYIMNLTATLVHCHKIIL